MIDKRNTIAKNIARYFHDGDFVNLGVGIPTQSANYLREGVNITLHSESGFVGQVGVIPGFNNSNEKLATEEDFYRETALYDDYENGWKVGHKDLCDATGDMALLAPGGACFDSVVAFMMARGGHLDATVLGGLQVDEEGNLANWAVPGKKIAGMGDYATSRIILHGLPSPEASTTTDPDDTAQPFRMVSRPKFHHE